MTNTLLNVWETEPKIVRKKRTISFEWIIEKTGDEERVAVLTVSSNHPESKNYSASLRQVKDKHEGIFTSRSFWLMAGLNFMSEAAPRFNQGKLEAFATRALDNLRIEAEHSEQITKYFDAEYEG